MRAVGRKDFLHIFPYRISQGTTTRAGYSMNVAETPTYLAMWVPISTIAALYICDRGGNTFQCDTTYSCYSTRMTFLSVRLYVSGLWYIFYAPLTYMNDWMLTGLSLCKYIYIILSTKLVQLMQSAKTLFYFSAKTCRLEKKPTNILTMPISNETESQTCLPWVTVIQCKERKKTWC